MGNLATCKTWEDVWLNESPTVFIQRKITEKISNTNHIHYSNNHKEIAGKAKVCHNAQNI